MAIFILHVFQSRELRYIFHLLNLVRVLLYLKSNLCLVYNVFCDTVLPVMERLYIIQQYEI